MEGQIGNPPQPTTDANAKAIAYIAKKLGESVNAVRATFAGELATYDAVSCHNQRAMMALQVQGSAKSIPICMGDFFSTGDGRMVDSHVKANYNSKSNCSFSFNPDTMQCLCCSDNYGHKVLHREDEEVANQGRILFMLADQASPPTMSSGAGCVRVIRLELGDIKRLMKLFLSTMRSFAIPPGSIVIVSSATQLATEGIQGYLKSLCEARDMLYEVYGGEVELLAGPPFLIHGADHPGLIRGILEMREWATRAQSSSPSLNLSWMCAADMVIELGTGGKQAPYEILYRSYANLDSQGPMSLWISKGWENMPARARPLPTEAEQRLADILFMELQDKFGLRLAPINVDRSLRERRPPPGPPMNTVMVVGSSNAERLAHELAELGHRIIRIKTKGWVPTQEKIKLLEDHVRRAAEKGEHEATIFMLLDNLYYMGKSMDGTTQRATRYIDGIYHIEGDLVVAPREAQLNILKSIKPILIAAGSRPFIMITPLPRYFIGPCCGEPSHLSNHDSSNFRSGLLRDLETTKETTRRFLFNENIRRSSTFSPAQMAEDWASPDLWEDPVHPRKELFSRLAKEIDQVLSRLDTKRKAFGESSEGDRERPLGAEWRSGRGIWRLAYRGNRGNHYGYRRGHGRMGGGHGRY